MVAHSFTSTLGRLIQEFKVILGYIARPYLKKRKEIHTIFFVEPIVLNLGTL
jgi:hypothetical protein